MVQLILNIEGFFCQTKNNEQSGEERGHVGVYVIVQAGRLDAIDTSFSEK